MPEDDPLGSDVDADVPVDDEVREADPGVWLGMPALGVPPEPPEEEGEEEEEPEEDDDELDEEDPPGEGMPPEELLDDSKHPAVTRHIATAPTVTARRICTVMSGVTGSMAVAPSGHDFPLVVGESGLAKLNGA